VASDALILFESLSFMSTDFGITDYLRGHQPSFVRMHASESGAPETFLSVRFPPRTTGEPAIDMDLTAWNIAEEPHSYLKQLKVERQLSATELWTVFNIRHALRSLQGSEEERWKIVRLRLYSFFLLVHSKVPPAAIQDYIRVGSRFMQDLVELSDIASEASSDLNLSKPMALSYIALENVLGLLENKLRRRSSFVVQSSILASLGLGPGSYPGSPANTGRSEGAWTSIVLSACAAAPALFNFDGTAPTTPSSMSTPRFGAAPLSPADISAPSAVAEKDISAHGKFIRIALELFVLSLSTRDASHVVPDMPLVGAIIGLIQTASTHVERILLRRRATGTAYAATPYDTHVLLIASKALYCVELILERPEYHAAFRESDGIAVLSRVLEIFATTRGGGVEEDKMSFADQPSRDVLERALCGLYLSMQKSRHTVIMQGNTTDTGVRVLYESYFSDLCSYTFASDFHANELLWAQLVMTIKEGIDLDPSFLSHFLQSKYAAAFKSVLVPSPTATFPSALFAAKPSTDLDCMIVPMARFVSAAAITAEGRSYVLSSRVIQFVLDAPMQPCCLLPAGREVDPSRTSKLGKILGQVSVEREDLRTVIRDLLKSRLATYAKEAAATMTGLQFDDAASLVSPRLQALQKLTYICNVIEASFTERRPRNDDFFREILNQDNLSALLSAYTASLPVPKQLFAQLALRHVGTAPMLGHNASGKSVTALLKYAVQLPTHSSTMIGLLCRELDRYLAKLTVCAERMRGGPDASAADSARDSNLQFPASAKSAKAGQSSVLLLNVLESVPHRCIIDPAWGSSLFADAGHNTHGMAWKYAFMASLLYVEWTTVLLSLAIRTDQKYAQSRAVANYMPTLKALFAFHKSSALEVSRHTASRLTAKVLLSCAYPRYLTLLTIALALFSAHHGLSLQEEHHRRSVPLRLRRGRRLHPPRTQGVRTAHLGQHRSARARGHRDRGQPRGHHRRGGLRAHRHGAPP
jgi:hypothetical protein